MTGPLTVALLGGGTVGAQVARLINDSAADFEQRVGAPIHLTAVSTSSSKSWAASSQPDR